MHPHAESVSGFVVGTVMTVRGHLAYKGRRQHYADVYAPDADALRALLTARHDAIRAECGPAYADIYPLAAAWTHETTGA